MKGLSKFLGHRIAALAVFLLLAFSVPSAWAQCPANGSQGRASAIANGHAYNKHVGGGEFVNGKVINGLAYPDPTVSTIQAFEKVIHGIMTGTSASRTLTGNRVAYWDSRTGTVVIFNPAVKECGTAFRPDRGVSYYNNLN